MFINLTEHNVTIRPENGVEIVIPPSGIVARVSSTPGTDIGTHDGVPMRTAPTWGAVEGLPAPQVGIFYIVSAMVAARCVGRTDVFAPDTGADAIREKEGPKKGQIVAVRRLIQAPQA